MSDLKTDDKAPKKIAIIPGDGIGKDVTVEAVKILKTASAIWDLNLELIQFPWSADHYLATGETLPAGALEMLRDEYSAVFIGAFGDPRVPDMKHAADVLLGIRFGLDLYINFRPVKAYADELVPLSGKSASDIDMVVFRENTEGAYVGVGGIFKRDTADEVALQEEIHTRKGVERIIRAAFVYAKKHGKGRVVMADKSNVMQYGHDLWQRCFGEVAADFPSIEPYHLFVDALAMQLIRKPEMFEVIVTNNMFGDIVTDLGAALQGGLGMAASANIHPGRTSMYEPVHGSAPKYAGSGQANPVGAILSIGLLLEDLGFSAAAVALDSAVVQSLSNEITTPDIGGSSSTGEVGDFIAGRLSDVAS